MQALKNEIKQKAIFMSLINIKETIKNIQDSADAEVMVISSDVRSTKIL
ncbi:Uncharacterised protein [Campylobacter coli]|nr:Uncharacterised protein [Campylobacter coli]